MSVNRVELLGNLGADAEIRKATSGETVAILSLCTNKSWVDKEGVKQTSSAWHRVVGWKWLAELATNYKKGDRLVVFGEIEYGSYQDKHGETKYTTEIRATRWHKLVDE